MPPKPCAICWRVRCSCGWCRNCVSCSMTRRYEGTGLPLWYGMCRLQNHNAFYPGNFFMKPVLQRVDGILLLDKPSGITSNGALQLVKRLFQAKKAGHTGSLDPLATGMLRSEERRVGKEGSVRWWRCHWRTKRRTV